jgi:hypothetical protein
MWVLMLTPSVLVALAPRWGTFTLFMGAALGLWFLALVLATGSACRAEGCVDAFAYVPVFAIGVAVFLPIAFIKGISLSLLSAARAEDRPRKRKAP